MPRAESTDEPLFILFRYCDAAADKCTHCIGQEGLAGGPIYDLVNGTCRAPKVRASFRSAEHQLDDWLGHRPYLCALVVLIPACGWHLVTIVWYTLDCCLRTSLPHPVQCGFGCIYCARSESGKPTCRSCIDGLTPVEGQCQPFPNYNAYCRYVLGKCFDCNQPYALGYGPPDAVGNRPRTCVLGVRNCLYRGNINKPSECTVCKDGGRIGHAEHLSAACCLAEQGRPSPSFFANSCAHMPPALPHLPGRPQATAPGGASAISTWWWAAACAARSRAARHAPGTPPSATRALMVIHLSTIRVSR